MPKPTEEYVHWINQLKERIRSAQIKAAIKVNTELLILYWELGREIIEKEKASIWGNKLIPQLSKDLLDEFPDINGFSRSNVYYIRKWYLFYNAHSLGVSETIKQVLIPGWEPIVQQAVGQTEEKLIGSGVVIPAPLIQIPWGHHIQIITGCNSVDEALFYNSQTIEHNWSRSMLLHQMESGLFKRKGNALTNFSNTLPKAQSDLANELLKNPYHFDFLMLGPGASEKDLEDALLTHLTKFLLELGAGFAFLGRQYKLAVENKDYELDLLFYHIRLRCHIAIELKIDEFKPEYAGKLNFYLSVLDAQVKAKEDQPAIGLLLCKKAGKLTVEYSLKNISTPIGVSEYNLTEKIPASMKGKLPGIKDIEKELKNIAGQRRK